MTYEQIEKEFDELFEEETWISKHLDVNDLATTREARHKFQSFLKQSFIKYLQGQIEYNKEKAQTFCGEYNNEKGIRAMCYLEFLQDQITQLQAQIKELDTSNN